MYIINIYRYIPNKYTSEMSKQSRSLFNQYGSYMLNRELQKIMDVHKLFCIFTEHPGNFTTNQLHHSCICSNICLLATLNIISHVCIVCFYSTESTEQGDYVQFVS